jgi:hypothetical protein
VRFEIDMRCALLGLALSLAACSTATPPPTVLDPAPVAVPGDPGGAVYIVTDATGAPDPGTGTAYSITYGAGGHWSVLWTCDTSLTGLNCLFDGTITAAAGDALAALAPQSPDAVNTSWYADGQASIDFSAVATSDVGGLSFDAPAGHQVTFDVLVDGARYREFVFLPSGDPAAGDLITANPRALPVVLQPTAP